MTQGPQWPPPPGAPPPGAWPPAAPPPGAWPQNPWAAPAAPPPAPRNSGRTVLIVLGSVVAVLVGIAVVAAVAGVGRTFGKAVRDPVEPRVIGGYERMEGASIPHAVAVQALGGREGGVAFAAIYGTGPRFGVAVGDSRENDATAALLRLGRPLRSQRLTLAAPQLLGVARGSDVACAGLLRDGRPAGAVCAWSDLFWAGYVTSDDPEVTPEQAATFAGQARAAAFP